MSSKRDDNTRKTAVDANNNWSSYGVGIGHVGSYQVSGRPWITGSTSMVANTEDKIEFPSVTKQVVVINHASQTLRIHFAPGAQGNTLDGEHYIELDSDEDSFTFNVKCKEIYLSTPSSNSAVAKYRVYAELTSIPTLRMYALTGSGITE